MLLNTLDPQTVQGFITAVRQLMMYCKRMTWIPDDFSETFHLPRNAKRKPIKTIPKKVQEEVLSKEWGHNSFTISRNHLINCLFIRRGLHPLEFPKLQECHIHPYEDLCYLEVFGKLDSLREVMLDQETFEALKIYMIERAHFMYKSSFGTSSTFGPDEYWEKLDPAAEFGKKFRMSWAALIKCVFELDPLKCPKCGGTMKIISFIEKKQSDVIEKILRHCGLWKDTPPRAPPRKIAALTTQPDGISVDYDFFASLAS